MLRNKPELSYIERKELEIQQQLSRNRKPARKARIFTPRFNRRMRKTINIMFIIMAEFIVISGLAQWFNSDFFAKSKAMSLFDFSNQGAIAMLALISVAMLSGLIFVAIGIKKDSRLSYWYKLLGLMSFSGSALAIVLDYFLPLNGKSIKEITHAFNYANSSFYISLVIIVITTVIALLLSTKESKKNNWYAFTSVAPFIIWAGLLYQKHEELSDFVSGVGLKKVSKMYSFYAENHSSLSLALINEYININFIVGMSTFLIVIFILGGVLIVWIEEKIKQGLKERFG